MIEDKSGDPFDGLDDTPEMLRFCPNDQQAKGLADIKDWFKNRTKDQQIYRCFGYAGTGKSTLVKHAIAELGLKDGGLVPEVLYACFTGKAALVLRRKGTPARTIHSLIYAVKEATEDEHEAVRQKIRDLGAKYGAADAAERFTISAMIAQAEQELKDMRRPRFVLNEASPVRDCKLVVIDEVSMVGQEMGLDLLSFGKPVLVLGDPGQLPPIKGEGFFTTGEPDVMLTEIHRQAEGSAIIGLATLARQGRPIAIGRHSDQVWKMRQRDVAIEHLLASDQVICGMNATRFMLNNAMRRTLGHAGTLPLETDKIICLKNDNEHGLINGMFLSMSDIEPVDELRFAAKLKDDEGEDFGALRHDGQRERFDIYAGHFADHEQLDLQRHDKDWKIKKRLVEATFGYAITCHKSQGSAWRNVCVWDDGLGRTKQDRNRWLYTAITRAEEGLLICE